MSETTPLDAAHDAMESAPGADAPRLAFYGQAASTELFLLLTAEPEGGAVLDPRLFETSQGSFVLAFDRLERLSDFADGEAPYAALSGRVLAAMLTGRNIGIALNPGVAPSSFLMSPEIVAWLATTLEGAPDEVEARPRSLSAPGALPDALLTALDARLASARGLARMAYLAAVEWDSGARGHLLAFVDAAPGAEGALARAVHEALTFSGLEAGTIDVAFFRSADPVAARLARVGLRFDLPAFEPRQSAPSAPGTDPDKPPRLR